MPHGPERAAFWADFICKYCSFPAPQRLKAQLETATFSDFCNCGCNSFSVSIPGDSLDDAVASGGQGYVFEADFHLTEEGKTLEILFFVDEIGRLANIEVICCGNTEPVPDEIVVRGPPFHIFASPRLLGA